MKRKVWLLATGVIFSLTVCLSIFFLNRNNTSEFDRIKKIMKIESDDQLKNELIGKSMFTKDNKIWIGETNTEIIYPTEVEKSKITSLYVKDNKLVIKSSHNNDIEFIELTDKEALKIERYVEENKQKINEDVAQNNDSNQNNENDCRIIIPRKTAQIGEKVTIPVEITNNPGVLGMTLTLQYDEETFCLTDVKNGDAFSDVLEFMKPKNFQSGMKLLWDCEHLEKNKIKDGSLVILEFEVNKKANKGTYGIYLDCAGNDVVNEKLEVIDVKIEDGEIIIQ